MRGNIAAALVLLLVCVASAAGAQTGLPLDIRDAMGQRVPLPQGGVGDLSADGARVAYTVCDPRRVEATADPNPGTRFSSTGVPRNAWGCDVWVQATSGGAELNVTKGRGNSWAPMWSPDGQRLVFYSDRDGAARLWEWRPRAVSLRRVSQAIVRDVFAARGYAPAWTHDGRAVVVPLLRAGAALNGELAGETRKTPIPRTDGATVTVFDMPRGELGTPAPRVRELPPWVRVDIGVINVATGAVHQLLSDVGIIGYRVSPTGPGLAVMLQRLGPSERVAGGIMDIALVSTTGSANARVVVRDIHAANSGTPLTWSPDGQWIAYAARHGDDAVVECQTIAADSGAVAPLSVGTHDPFEIEGRSAPLWDANSEGVYLLSNDSVWRLALGERKTTRIATLPGRRLSEITSHVSGLRPWSPDGHSLFVWGTNHATRRVEVARVDVSSGQTTVLSEIDARVGTIDMPAVGVDGASRRLVLLQREDASHPTDLWTADERFSPIRQLTHLNPQLERYTFGEARLVRWGRADGTESGGALMLPTDYKQGTRYPLMVWQYPTLHGSDSLHRFGMSGISAFNMQMFATRGYAALFPDCDVRVGTPMRDIHDCVMPGVDFAIETGIADPARLAVMGQSYGGYGVASLIVQTGRFKAAVMTSGFADLSPWYGAMTRAGIAGGIQHLETGQGHIGAPPWSAPQLYVDNSPIFFLDRVTTPLMIEAGLTDDAVPSALSEEVFVGLRRLGKPVTLLEYANEGHVLHSYANLHDWWSRVLQFLAAALKASGSK